MKRGTPRHPKTSDLAARLKIPHYSAVGLLELLWHFASEFARAGDVGRFSDGVISKALSWDGDSTMLVSCLVDAKWLDRCECHRLRIHDWPEHADQTVFRVLHAQGQGFLKCYDGPSTMLASCQDQTSQPKANTNTNTNTNTVRSRDNVVERIYLAYPRRIGRPKAFTAIAKAIKRFSSEDVLAATEMYAKTWEGETDLTYCPHPATWFNQDRFNDDPETWKRSRTGNNGNRREVPL